MDFDFIHFLSTGAAVFLGIVLALSTFWPSVQSELRRHEGQQGQAAEAEAERLERLSKKAYERREAFEKKLSKAREKLPYFKDYPQGRRTSKEYNIEWARRYYKELEVPNTFFYRASDDYVDHVVGHLYEVHQCYHDLWLGERQLNFDEELLEIERLRRNPRKVADQLDAIRRHNVVLPIVRDRLKYRQWDLLYYLNYLQYVSTGMEREAADAKAAAEFKTPRPEWPGDGEMFGEVREHFYLVD
jgi:hypothetical protein